MLTAIMLMGLFLDIVIVPLGILGEHVDCLKMLVAIISLLQVGDISRTSELRTAIHTYHVLFFRLYPQCAKTKLHALQHVVDSWEYWMTLLSCFGPERKHRLMKKVMQFSYRNAGKTTLAHSIRKYIRSLLLPHAFTAVHFSIRDTL